jgi:hypothetical protein
MRDRPHHAHTRESVEPRKKCDPRNLKLEPNDYDGVHTSCLPYHLSVIYNCT